MEIRVGIIGFGDHMTSKLIPALRNITDIKLVYGSCRTREMLVAKQSELGLTATTTNWEDMVSKEYIDAVIVSGPPSLHIAVAERAIIEGIHVFCEKPLSIDRDTAHKIAALAKDNPEVVTSVGFNFTHIDMLKSPHLSECNAVITCDARAIFQTPLLGTKDVVESFLYAVLIHPIAIISQLYGMPTNIEVKSCTLDGGHFCGEILLKSKNQNTTLKFSNTANKFNFNAKFFGDNNNVETFDASGGTSTKEKSYELELIAFFNTIRNRNTDLHSNFIRNAEVQDYVHEIYSSLKDYLEKSYVIDIHSGIKCGAIL